MPPRLRPMWSTPVVQGEKRTRLCAGQRTVSNLKQNNDMNIQLPPTFQHVTDGQRFTMIQAALIHARYQIQPGMRVIKLGDPMDKPEPVNTIHISIVD